MPGTGGPAGVAGAPARAEQPGLARPAALAAGAVEQPLTLQRQLASASDPAALEGTQDSSLLDRQPRTLREAFNRIRLQLTPTSLLFRHALRMAIATVAGYAALHAIHPEQGYWVLLTTVFVCQPNYGATRIKLVQRISGTVLGRWSAGRCSICSPASRCRHCSPWSPGGVLRHPQHALHPGHGRDHADGAVLLQRVGDGYGLIWPRLFDTLLGSLIAAAAVFLILPVGGAGV